MRSSQLSVEPGQHTNSDPPLTTEGDVNLWIGPETEPNGFLFQMIDFQVNLWKAHKPSIC